MFIHRSLNDAIEEESGFERTDVNEVETNKSLTNMNEMGIADGSQNIQSRENGSVDQASLLPTESDSKDGDSISVSESSVKLDSIAGDSSDDRSTAVSDSDLYPSGSVFENDEESTRSTPSLVVSSDESSIPLSSESALSSTEELPSATTSPPNEESSSASQSLPTQAPSSESESPLYHRKPRNTSPRTPYNDIYRNTRNSNHIARHGEFEFEQDYVVKYYEGSSPDTMPRNRSALPSYDHYDVTVISQTSCIPSHTLMTRKERLFFFNHLLQRWKGYSRRPIPHA